jgi:hypothetical protein
MILSIGLLFVAHFSHFLRLPDFPVSVTDFRILLGIHHDRDSCGK